LGGEHGNIANIVLRSEDGVALHKLRVKEMYEFQRGETWRALTNYCSNRSIFEIDEYFGAEGFYIADEGMTDTQHGVQPFHVWRGNWNNSMDMEYEVEVWLAYGRGGHKFIEILVDGESWEGE